MKIKQNYKAVKRNIKRFQKNSFFRAKFWYAKYYDEYKIKENEFLIQCYSGNGITGNVFYIVEEICTNTIYQNIKIYFAANTKTYENVKKEVEKRGWKQVEVIKLHSRMYCKKLAECKYLINNVTFPTYFIKKEGQIYLNTWHGTPLKTLGKAMTEEMHEIGNMQRNFFMCDYLLAPNRFTMDILRQDYMLNNFYHGQYLLCGYPRNHIFYDTKKQDEIRKKLELENKNVIVYMPTWRGSHKIRKDHEQFYYIMHMLIELDKHMNEDTIVFVKEHNMSSLLIDFKEFENIKPFPEEMETYEFLSIADCLITDYSSVMFDFANTGRKIILYSYDKEEYLHDRGMYMEFDKLPFTISYTTRELIEEVNKINMFKNYQKEIEPFILYDKNNTVSDILQLMLKGYTGTLDLIKGETYNNGKENILIFGGALLRNGITTALKGVLNNLDKCEKNYILTFYRGKIKERVDVLKELGDFEYIPIMGEKIYRFSEGFAHFLYYRLNIDNRFIEKKLKSLYEREIKRVYPGINFECVIHYTGYERQIMNLFRYMDSYRIMYVHNDLVKEHKNRDNLHIPTVKSCYNEYDSVVLIRKMPLSSIINGEKIKDKLHIAHNFNNYKEIIEKAKLPVEFDENTECNISFERLEDILGNEKNTIYINIARFSSEKGLDNLVKAFTNFYIKGNNDNYLIIIGGHGNTYNDILEQVDNSEAKDNIIIIRSLSNPFSILDKSDVFILSSHYEGLPMVIMEALILRKPVISTAIEGPKEFLEQGYGYLVEDSVEGLCQGMEEYKKNKLSFLMEFDYESFNKQALEEFKSLFPRK